MKKFYLFILLESQHAQFLFQSAKQKVQRIFHYLLVLSFSSDNIKVLCLFIHSKINSFKVDSSEGISVAKQSTGYRKNHSYQTGLE